MKCSQKVVVSAMFVKMLLKIPRKRLKTLTKEAYWGKKVKIDFTKMLEVQEKLANGEVIDSATVNGILLGGIMNILLQHKAIEDLDKRVKSVEAENRARVESLESWNAKQSEKIKTVAEHI